MDKGSVFVFAEPGYSVSSLYAKSLAGLERGAAKHGVSLSVFEGFEAPAGRGLPHAAVILSKRTDWTGFLVARLRALGVRSVLVGTLSDTFGEDVSGPTLDRRALVRSMVEYFARAGRRRLACYGAEPLDCNDTTRREAFLAAARAMGLRAREKDVFGMESGLDECAGRFLAHVREYDGVICVNDVAAVHLMARAQRRGVRVPDDLFVAGSGDFMLGAMVAPTLTTTTLDYYQMGLLGVDIWRMLEGNPSLQRAVLTLPSEIISRGSTAFAPVRQDPPEQEEIAVHPDDVPDADGMFLWNLENLLLRSDEEDLGIMREIAMGSSIPAIAARLFVSPGTVNYRLRKIYQELGIPNKPELTEILGRYISEPGPGDGINRS
ncbi:MAG TPA: substrate-binding domain-containing protein [Candidatus Limnocylindria bacterium]|nr:substrate-binding domain-containing protein [Candidatus Limnocylindria bacterium]